MNFKVLDIPTEPWVHRLRRGHYVWLVKEREYARVEWPWEPPEPGCICGRLGVHRYSIGNMTVAGSEQTWFMGSLGEGLDYKPLIAPCENNLPENPDPIPSTEIMQIRRELEWLHQRIRRLEQAQMQQEFQQVLDTLAVLGRNEE